MRVAAGRVPLLAMVVMGALAVGLACTGGGATPSSPPTATPPPSPSATATLMPVQTPYRTAAPTATATLMPRPTFTRSDLAWIERYMQSPGYRPEWGIPRVGGILKVGMPLDPTSFNPNTGGSFSGPMFMPMYNGLARFDPWVGQGAILPDLARSWEFSSDNLHLTLHLEEGVTFQDNPKVPAEYNGGKITGDVFTCEDVQASVERHVRPPVWEKSITWSGANLGYISSVSCPDGPRGYTVVLNLDTPRAKTMASLAQGTLVMMDRDFIDWLNTEHPAGLDRTTPETYLWGGGTGPFAPGGYGPDVIVKNRRNPTYFRQGLPLLDGIDNLILKDYTTRFTALATGQIQVLGHGSTSLLPGQVAQAERDFKGRIVVQRALDVLSYGMRFNPARAPYDDVRVRRAMHLAMNRNDWMAFRQSGSYPGAVLTGTLAPNLYWSHTEEELGTWPGLRQPKDEDIAEANRLLDQVFGTGKRFQTSCQVRNSQAYMDTCLFFADQMKRSLGIDVTMDFAETAVDTEKSDAGQYDIRGGAQGSMSTGDPDDLLFSQFHRGYASAASAAHLEGVVAAEPVLQAEIEALIDAQSSEMDPARRREMTRELDWRITNELVSHAIQGWAVIFYGITPDVQGFYLYDYGPQSYWPLYERLWLAN